MSNNVKKISNIAQGSPEWHQLRTGKYVSSTLSYRIRNSFGDSAIAQFYNRAGPIQKKYSDMGHLGERLVRKHLLSIGHDLSPEQPIFINEELGILSSVDGLSNCGSTLYEVKMVEKDTSETYVKACKGLVRDSHMYQIQHSMLCNPEFKKCTYIVARLTEGVTGELDVNSLRFVHVYPDKTVQAKIAERAKEFLKAMKEGTLEVPNNALPSNHLEIAKSLIDITGTIDYLTELKEELRQKLIAIGPHKANGVQVTKINGKKNIDFNAALNKVWSDLRQEEQLIIKNSVDKHTTFAEDHFRVQTKKTIMYVNK